MRKTTTSERLKCLMSERQLRQVDILNLCKPYCEKYNVKVDKNHISQYINGKAEPRQDKLSILAMALDVDEAWLIGFDVPMKKTSEPPIPQSNGYPTVRIPVLGDVAAGVPILAQQDIIGYEDIPADMAKTGEYFGLKIKGDSMEPKIHDNDIVIVKSMSNAENNDIVIAMINNEATCKRLHKYSNSIVLTAINSDYKPIEVTPDENIYILGKVVMSISKF